MEQTVKSYVRRNKYQPNETESTDNTIGMVIGAALIILFAIVYIQATIGVSLLIGAAYGVKTIAAQNLRQPVTEAVTQPQEVSQAPKVKRHYSSRIKVNHFQGKSVRV